LLQNLNVQRLGRQNSLENGKSKFTSNGAQLLKDWWILFFFATEFPQNFAQFARYSTNHIILNLPIQSWRPVDQAMSQFVER
jgi:hypothetical protein